MMAATSGRAPHRLRPAAAIARTFQIVQPFAGLTVRENIAVGAHLSDDPYAPISGRRRRCRTRCGLGNCSISPGIQAHGRRPAKRLELARAPPSETAAPPFSTRCSRVSTIEIRDICGAA